MQPYLGIMLKCKSKQKKNIKKALNMKKQLRGIELSIGKNCGKSYKINSTVIDIFW